MLATQLTARAMLLIEECKIHMVVYSALTLLVHHGLNQPLVTLAVAAYCLYSLSTARHGKPVARVEYIDDKVPSGIEKPTEEKFLVIGAGYVGLGNAGHLRRAGIPFDLVEADDAVGGNWHHGVYETVHIISSKLCTEFNDFPMPKEYPDFPSYIQMRDYLNAYADHFQLRKHLQLKTNVTRLTPINGKNGLGEQWEVVLEHDGVETTKIYKGIIVCTGHHWTCRMPSYPGQDKFKGKIIHSKQYRTPTQLVGQRVLVVGGGNSACDVVVEASRFAASAHLSVRRGYWYLPRTFFGVPLTQIIHPVIPQWFSAQMTKLLTLITSGPQSKYGLPTPTIGPFDTHPTINSSLLQTIDLGAITPHSDIEKFTEDKVFFKDGSVIEVDLIVFATGFHMTIPILGDLVKYKDGVPQMLEIALVPGLRNCYSGIGEQVRYGIGPLISQYAKVNVEYIKVQDRCKNNLSDIVFALGGTTGQKAAQSSDILQDPFRQFQKNNYYLKVIKHYNEWEDELIAPHPMKKIQ